MRFKSDSQRRAIFASMNKFSKEIPLYFDLERRKNTNLPHIPQERLDTIRKELVYNPKKDDKLYRFLRYPNIEYFDNIVERHEIKPSIDYIPRDTLSFTFDKHMNWLNLDPLRMTVNAYDMSKDNDFYRRSYDKSIDYLGPAYASEKEIYTIRPAYLKPENVEEIVYVENPRPLHGVESKNKYDDSIFEALEDKYGDMFKIKRINYDDIIAGLEDR